MVLFVDLHRYLNIKLNRHTRVSPPFIRHAHLPLKNSAEIPLLPSKSLSHVRVEIIDYSMDMIVIHDS